MNIVPDLPLVLAQLAPLFVLMFGLNTLLFKPMLSYLAERRQVTEGVAHEAAAVAERADARVKEWEQLMARARGEIAELRASRRATANANYQDIVSAARRESEARLAQGLADLRRDAEAARAELRPQAQVVAALMTARVLGRSNAAEA